MGGGSAIIVMGDMFLDRRFNHEFDSMVDLSGAGGNASYQAAFNITKPVMFIDGNSDCMCPPDVYADVYYDSVPNNNGQCKYETLIMNATHCNFASLGGMSDNDCLEREAPMCPGQKLPPHLSVQEQNSVAAKYMLAFMDATLKNENDFDSLNELIQNDLGKGVLFSSVSNNCD